MKASRPEADFELVFVSSDRDEASWREYCGEMPGWKLLPWDDRKRKGALSAFCQVRPASCGEPAPCGVRGRVRHAQMCAPGCPAKGSKRGGGGARPRVTARSPQPHGPVSATAHCRPLQHRPTDPRNSPGHGLARQAVPPAPPPHGTPT